MTLDVFLIYLIRGAFIILSGLSILAYIQHGGSIRRDIALMLLFITTPITIPLINTFFSNSIPALSTLGTLALLAQPYWMLRLLAYFRPVPKLINRIVIIITILFCFSILLIDINTLQPLTFLIIAFFVIVNFYAMQGFVLGAATTTGVTHQRLRFTAIGSGLFAFALLLVGISALLPSLSNIVAILVLVIILASAITFSLGLTPFRWLRKMWQLTELQNLIGRLTDSNLLTERNDIFDTLIDLTKEATGAKNVQVILRNETSTLVLYPAQSEISQEIGNSSTYIGENWQTNVPISLSCQKLSPEEQNSLKVGEANWLYLVPLERNQHQWGMMLVYMEYGSLFTEDDLNLLRIYAEHTCIMLENNHLLIERTQQAQRLEAVNKELESFSYSVSHDLRSPLRALDGFSQALFEDYHDILDDDGKEYLDLIRFESQRMGQLIDDLIDLSRYTRAELRRTEVNLSTIAKEIASSLQSQDNHREAKFLIQDDLIDCADPHLMQVVLQNLIGNSWKYTSQQEQAHIELGTTNGVEKTEYFVRDNGAGFDMAYVHKLFGAFQRLHAASEYEGTGIGLATVQRIIHRHGGNIRAEGVVDKGATFYFTLGNESCE